MDETPVYIRAAVDLYFKRGDPRLLEEFFRRGLPLHEFPESCELVCKLLRGEAVKPKGRQPLTPEDHYRQEQIAQTVATFHGAGFPLESKSEKKKRTSACEIAERANNGAYSAEYIRKTIWKKYRNHESVKHALEDGKRLAAMHREYALRWLGADI